MAADAKDKNGCRFYLTYSTLKIETIKKLTLAKNVMLDVSATAVAFFSKRLKLQMSNGVLMVHDIC